MSDTPASAQIESATASAESVTAPPVGVPAPSRYRRRRRSAAAGLALVALSSALAGCGLNLAANDQSGERPAGPAVGDAEQAEPGGPQAAPPEEGGGSGVAEGVPVAERDLVHSADLAVEVEGVHKAAGAAGEWTEEAGGYIASESVQTAEGSPPHASLTLHVPQDRYEDALEEFADLGSRSNIDRRVEDVTEEAADVDSRVESAEASLDRLRDLLDDAESVEDVLDVEEQISTRQQDLEALQARQESLEEQTAYGTVRLDLSPPETYVEEPGDDSIGFLGGLQRGWQALVGLGEVLAVAAGWLLPFLAVAAVIGTPTWLGWRRRARGRRAGADAAAAQPVPAGAGDSDAPPKHDSTAGGERSDQST